MSKRIPRVQQSLKIKNKKNKKFKKNFITSRCFEHSNYSGVSWIRAYNKWKAQRSINGRSCLGGYYDNEEEAARASDDLIRKFGEAGTRARINFPEENIFCCNLIFDEVGNFVKNWDTRDIKNIFICWRSITFKTVQ